MEREPLPWWRGTRGEWWVLVQSVLLVATALLPRVGPPWGAPSQGLTRVLGLGLGVTFVVLGARTLGASLTVLPRPHNNARFVQTGIYRLVRHPIYSGIIFLAVGWALWRTSVVHLALAAVLLGFFDAKARREEQWLMARFPEYTGYRRQVRKLIPGIY